ncbi:MAG: alpha-L-fucosidase [Acutalibacteraceae bacterium]|nr:alpha-L-fucosidase [Acutalibacteraceae bacterium]
MNNIEFFKNAGYGMMMHFGLYSLLGGEYKGKFGDNYAEWIGSHFAIPIKEYEKLASAFNPIYFNADEIIKLAKDCGMKYFVVTTKHHDGFALFHSKVDKYNVVDATPYGRDIIEDLANACAKHDVKLGFYYSQDLDWHEKHGGGYLSNHMGCSGVTWDNSWDFPNPEEKNFDICFENKILPQIKEIMSNYGDIFLAWFDVPMTLTDKQSKIIYDTVKSLQPDCLINSRLGNGIYDYVSLGDNEIPETKEEWEKLSKIDPQNINYQSIDGFKPSPYGLYESACTLNNSWGFSYRDHNWKSPEELYKNKKHLNELGINYLVNVGPDHLGRIPGPSIEILRKAAEMENK